MSDSTLVNKLIIQPIIIPISKCFMLKFTGWKGIEPSRLGLDRAAC